ncbi:hypothetical protein GPECTOR_16g597 [Gonium pectorale]|uniref:glycerol kinase n=1 Tax=Gonium pectorale TaxID=33097 RepID=A0A150GKS8_GONPE|nr:hypothetical protein GPECTOR_16g597 [Gonium pectorale]|eukprot:KXZ50423.1 hypothetical protein GPECTOR_16g597 [Gonium pectorale]
MDHTDCIGAVDQGTQSTRVFIFDKDCNPIASHQVDLPQIYPQAGAWKAAQEAVAAAGRPPLRMLALGITNQRETTVVWSRTTGRPLHNAIVWLDNRTSDLCEQLCAAHGGRDAFRAVTGLPVSPYFSATKYLWLYDNVPEVRAAVDGGDACVGTVDSWLIWQLTGGAEGGVHVTDVTNASRTLLMDLDSLDWHDPTLEAFRCPRAALPRIASNAEVYGHITPTAATDMPYGHVWQQAAAAADGGGAVNGGGAHPLAALAGVPIAGSLGDQMAAVLGQRCRPGEAKNTYGTGCFMLLNTGQRRIASTHGLLTTVAFKLGPAKPTNYALEGSVAVAGLGISWLRDNLGLIGSAAESEELAASVRDTGGVYFVPAFSGLLAPRWRADARGVLLGMTSFTTRAHVVRAMLEAICFQTREVLDAMRHDAQLDEHHGGLGALRVDGGAAANDLLMQLQADLLQVPVLRPAFRETTSLGAALAAGLAVGFWSREEVFAGHGAGRVDAFAPAVGGGAAARRYGRWRKAVERALDLADLAPEEGEEGLDG